MDRTRRNPNASLRAVTLTLKHGNAPLKNQIRRLFKCFATLRRRKAVKPLFAGGTFVLEIKISKHDRRWHPHLHIITEGEYVHIHDLSAAWQEVTKDSFRCYIKAIPNIAQAVGHDTKYITKATDDSVFGCQTKLDEYIQATRGVRAYGTFGSWRGLNLTERRAENGNWVSVGSLHMKQIEAEAGDPHWRAVLNYLKTRIIAADAAIAKDTS